MPTRATQSAPLISCIVPVFNGERYLAEALESIFAQTHRPIEIIVIDDGSTDGTPDVAARFKSSIKYIRQTNAGPPAARNRGLSEAESDFIAFLDADDLWHPEKLARQLRQFETHANLDVSIAYIQNFWVAGLKDEEARLRREASSETGPGYGMQTMMIRRQLCDRIGGLDSNFLHRDAIDWLLRASDQGAEIDILPQVLVYRRIHEHNLSRRRSSVDREDLLMIVKKTLDRRRAAAGAAADTSSHG